ncbi:hypothetical protein GCM10027038_06450 [Arthrobacter bambusae]
MQFRLEARAEGAAAAGLSPPSLVYDAVPSRGKHRRAASVASDAPEQVSFETVCVSAIVVYAE